MRPETVLRELGPEEAALHVFSAHGHEDAWLDAFADSLDRRRAGQSLARTLKAWGLSQAEAARCFGVSRQAIGKWLRQGVPAERKTALSDLAAATDLLVHYLKRDRIPAVVRRPIQALDGVSLLELLATGDYRGVLAACREMFSFDAPTAERGILAGNPSRRLGMVANRGPGLGEPPRSRFRGPSRWAVESAGQFSSALSQRRHVDGAIESARLHRQLAIRTRGSSLGASTGWSSECGFGVS